MYVVKYIYFTTQQQYKFTPSLTMAGVSKFKKALSSISAYLDSFSKRVFSDKEINDIFYQKKEEWDLPERMYKKDFIEQLENHLSFKYVNINCIGNQKYVSSELERYTYGDVSPFEVALSIRSNTYLSHFSSMFLLGLTEQLPKVIYVTFEQTSKLRDKAIKINQDSIHTAFSKAQREPDHYFAYQDYKIVLLNSKSSNKAGVSRSNSIYGKNLPIANIERTIIDITVRPAYSGGVTEVLKAYEKAANVLSINKIMSILSKLDYIYPYHQAIGFYLEKSGRYKERQIDLLREKEIIYDFYLTYNMSNREYSNKWNLYYPKNF